MTTFKWLALAGLAAAMFPALYAEGHCPGNVVSIRSRSIGNSIIIVDA
jgi:hypothetical protein